MSDDTILAESERPGLHTDFYELTMAAGYFCAGRADEIAHFELFIRGFGPGRKFYVYAGLQTVLEFLEKWAYGDSDIDFLRTVPALSHLPAEFFEYLGGLKFTGDLFSVPEGEIVFPSEPIVRIRAPIIQAQLLETALLAIVNHQTSVATKAARVAYAAGGRNVIEFGSRRAHGLGAAAWGARAAYIGGCAGTSNCYAGWRFGIPLVGTIAHSWIMSFDSEEEAFEEYAKTFPDRLLLLVDTYDTLEGARRAAKFGSKLLGVRIDSGDLFGLSKEVRRILDDAGLHNAHIFASGDLDEHKVRDLVSRGAPINAFGVGSELITSRDAPALGGVYKLVAVEDAEGRMTLKRKLSAQKATIPGPKQIFRRRDESGRYRGDILKLFGETPSKEETELVRQYMNEGIRIRECLPVEAVAAYTRSQLRHFDEKLQDFDSAYDYHIVCGGELTRIVRTDEVSIPVDGRSKT